MKAKASEASVANKTSNSAKEYLKQEVSVGDVYFASLEPRIALDAAAGADLVDEVLDTTDVELEAVELTAPVAQSASAADLVQMLEADAEAGSASDLSRQIVFVDASIDNFDEFIAGLPVDIETYVISPDHDGISQIASTLAGRSGIEAIHIVSHGDAGALILGDSLVTAESIQGRYADDLAAIGASLTDSADLLIYGCDFAFGAEGEAAADLLASATGADVAASTDITGSEIFGGDWVLEHETGEIEADALQVDEWEGKLNNTVVEVSLDGSYNFSADDFDGGRDGTISTITIVALPTDGELTLNGEAVVEGQEIAAADLASLLYTPPAGGDVNVDYRLYYSVDDDVGPNPSPPVAIVIDTYADYTVPNADYFATTASSPQVHPVRAFNILAVPDGGSVIYTNTGSQRPVGGTFTQAQVDAGQVVVRYNSGEFGEPIDGLVVEVQRDINTNNFTSDFGLKFADNRNARGGNGQLFVSDGSHKLTDGIYARVDNYVLTRTLVVPADAAYFETLITGIVGQGTNIRVNIIGTNADGTSDLLHAQVIANDPMVDIKLDVSGYESIDLTYTTTDGSKNKTIGLEKPVFTMATSQIVTSAQEVAAIDTRGLQAAPEGETWDSFELSSVPDNGVLQLGGVDLVAGTSYQMSDLDNVLFVPNADTAVGRDAELFSLSLTASDGSTAQEVVSIDILSSQSVPASTDISIAVEEGTSQSFSAADFAFAGLGGNSVDEVIIDFLPSWGTLTLDGVAVTTGQAIAVSDIENFVFVPDADAYGIPYNSFDFRVRDSAGTLSDTYTVALDVYSRPVITVPSITVAAGEVHSFAVRDFGFSDADGDSMGSIIVDAVPAQGGLRLNGVLVAAGQEITVEDLGNLTFDASAAGTTGSYDSFSIRLGDEDGHYSDVAVVGIDIGVPPTTADNTISTSEDIDYTFSTSDFAFSDDNAGDSLAGIFIDNLPATGILSLNGVAVTADQEIAAADIANLVYSPPAELFGTDFASFTFAVKDSTNLYSLSSSTITIDVTSVEDAPEGADNTVSTVEDTDFTFAQSDFGFSDGDADSTFASVIIDSLPATGVLSSGVLSLNGVDVTIGQEIAVADIANLVYSPIDDQFRTAFATFSFSVRDNTGLVSVASNTMTIDVASVEDTPEGADNRFSIAEDTDHTFTVGDFGFSDVDELSDADLIEIQSVPTVVEVSLDGSYSFDGDDFDAGRGGTISTITILALPTDGALTLNGEAVGKGQQIATADLGSLLYTPPADGDVNVDYRLYYSVDDDIGPNPSPPMAITIDTYDDYVLTGAEYFHDERHSDRNLPTRAHTLRAVPDGRPIIFTDTGEERVVGRDILHLDTVEDRVIVRYYSGVPGEPIDGLVVESKRNVDVEHFESESDANLANDRIATGSEGQLYVSDGSRLLQDGIYVQATDTEITRTLSIPRDVSYFQAGIVGLAGQSQNIHVQIFGFGTGVERTLLHDQIIADDPTMDIKLDVSGYESLDLVYSTTDGTSDSYFGLHESMYTTATSQIVTSAQEAAAIDTRVLQDPPAGETWDSFELGFVPQNGVLQLGGVDLVAGTSYQMSDLENVLFVPDEGATIGRDVELFSLVLAASDGSTMREVVSVDIVSTQENLDSTFAAVVIDSLPASGTLVLNGVAVAAGEEIAVVDIPNLVYSPPTNEFGADFASFTFSVKDKTGLVSDASNTMTFDVTSLEDAPEGADITISTDEDTDHTFSVADFGFSDGDADSTFATVIIDSLPFAGVLSLNGVDVTAGEEIAVADIANLVYSPPAELFGAAFASFAFSVKDNTGRLSLVSNIVSIDVTAIEDAPDAADNTLVGTEETDFSFTVADFGFSDDDNFQLNHMVVDVFVRGSYSFSADDFDALRGGTTSSITIAGLPVAGGLTLNGVAVVEGQEIAAADLGSLLYTPPAGGNANVDHSFYYSIVDDIGPNPSPIMRTLLDSYEEYKPNADYFADTSQLATTMTLRSFTVRAVPDGSPVIYTSAGVPIPVGDTFTKAQLDAGEVVIRYNSGEAGDPTDGLITGTNLNVDSVHLTGAGNGALYDNGHLGTNPLRSYDASHPINDGIFVYVKPTLSTYQVDVPADATHFEVVSTQLDPVYNRIDAVTVQYYGVNADGTSTLLYEQIMADEPVADLSLDVSGYDKLEITTISTDGIASPANANLYIFALDKPVFTLAPEEIVIEEQETGGAFAAVVIDALPASGTLALNGVAVAAGDEIAVADIANLIYSPGADVYGSAAASFTFSTKDSSGLTSESHSMSFDLEGTPDAPEAADITVSTDEDVDHIFSVSDFGFSTVDRDSSFAAVIIDSVPASGAFTLNGVTVTAGQEIALADIANLVYSPPAEIFGSSLASFTFSVKDSTGLVSLASNTITIDVTSVEDAPESADNTLVGIEETDFSFRVVDFSFSDTDAGNSFAAVVIHSLPASGTLAVNGAAVTAGQEIAVADIPNLVYSPYTDVSGDAVVNFTFSTMDNTGLTSEAYRMSFDIEDTPDAPEGTDGTISTDEDIDHIFSVADFGFSTVDIDSTFAAVTIDSLPTSGAFTLNGVDVTTGQEIVVADIPNLVFSPPANIFGADFASFTFSVKDNTGLVSEASNTITIDVTSVEDAPESTDNTVTTAEDVDYTFNLSDFSFSDLDADSTFAAVVIDNLPTSGTLSLNGAAVATGQEIAVADIASLVYSPPADEFGTGLGSFTFSVKDSGGLVSVASSTITIDVTSVEDAPEAADVTISTDEDTDHIFSSSDFGFSDVDDDSTFATVIIDSLPTSGTFTLNGVDVTTGQEIALADIPSLVYSPPANIFGADFASFTFSVQDNTGRVSEASSTMTIDITSVEDAPESADNTVSTAEDTDYLFSLSEFGFSDVDADSTLAAVVIDALPTSGTLALNGAAVTTGQEVAVADIANLIYSPAASEFGAGLGSFTFSVKDSAGLVSEASSTITIDVTSVEDAPEGADNTVSTAEDTDFSFSQGVFGFSDVDADSSFAAVIIESLPALGTLSLNGAAVTGGQEIAVVDISNLVYSPPAQVSGTDFASFSFSVTDDSGLISNQAQMITIDVESVNDAPEGVDNAVATPQDTGYRFTLADFEYSDIDGNEFASVIIDRLPTSGTLSLNGIAVTTGQEIAHADIEALSFVSEDSSGSMPLSFSYRLRDDGGTSNGGIDTSEPYIMNIAVESVYELSATFAANGVLEIDLTAELAAELNLDTGDSVTRNADPATAHIEFEYLDGSGQRVLFEAGDSITASQAQSLAISSSDIRMIGEFTVGFVIDRADGSRGHVGLLLDVTPATSDSLPVSENSQSDTKQLSRVIEHADKIASKVMSISETQSLSLPAVARGFAASGQGQGLGQSQGFDQSQDFGGASLSTDAESFATGSVAGLQVIDRAESSVHNMRVDLAVSEDQLLVAIDDLSAQFGEGGLVVEMLDGSAIPDWITITATGEIEIDTSESGDVGLVELRVVRQSDDGKGDDGKGDDANQQGTAVSVNLAENSVQITSGADPEQ